MAQVGRSVATLRVAGVDLVPDEVSELLGIQPTHAQRKGQPSRSGMHIATFGLWRLEARNREPENVNGQVEELLSQVTSKLEVWRVLGRRFEVDLFCGWFMNESNEGLDISPASLLALGERGIQLSLDIYAPTTAE
jgi:hypothetical protein